MNREKHVWCAAALLAIVGGVQACATSKPAKSSPECADEQLAKIEAAFLAEAIEACAGKTTETCEALPAIRAKYDAKRQEWVACSK